MLHLQYSKVEAVGKATCLKQTVFSTSQTAAWSASRQHQSNEVTFFPQRQSTALRLSRTHWTHRQPWASIDSAAASEPWTYITGQRPAQCWAVVTILYQLKLWLGHKYRYITDWTREGTLISLQHLIGDGSVWCSDLVIGSFSIG